MKRVSFSEVDTTDEIANNFNKVIDNLNLIESKVCQLDKEVENMKTSKRKKEKERGMGKT